MKHQVTRRHLLAGAAAVTAVKSFPTPAIGQETRFVVGTYGGLYEKTLRQRVIPNFEKDHGVKVSLELGVGSTFIPKIIASRGNSPYDIIYLDAYEAMLGDDANLWAPDQSKHLPNLARVYPALKPPSLPLYGCMVYDFPLVYNPKKLKDPKSWNDIWNPNITAGVPYISNTYGLVFLYLSALLNGGNEKNLGPGFAAIKRLPHMKIFKGVTQGFSMFEKGEIDAALFYGHRAQQLRDKGIEVLSARPKEGVWGQRGGVQIPKKVKNLELSRAWANMALSVPYQSILAEHLYSPSNGDVPIKPEERHKYVYGPEAIAALKFAPWKVLNAERDSILNRWSREFG